MQAGTALQIQETSAATRPVSLWHLVVLIAWLLMPFSWWPGAKSLLALLKSSDRVTIYILEIEFQWLTVLFVCVGLFITKTSITHTIGKIWQTREDFFKDAKTALGYFLISLFIALLCFVAFGPAYRHHARDLPENSLELLAFLPLALGAGFGEELIFRGYLQTQFRKLTGSLNVAIILQAILFALAHGYDQRFSSLLDKFIVAVLMSSLVIRKGSLLPAMLTHAFIDCFVGFASVLFR